MKNFVKMLVSAIVGFNAMCVAIMCDASDKVCVSVYVVVALFVAVALGVFDMPERKREHGNNTMRTIKHNKMRDAA